MRSLIAALALLSQTACVSGIAKGFVADLTPEAKADLAKDFLAKCSGGFHFSAGGATGQLGGGAHADLDLTGTCGPTLVPLNQIASVIPAQPAKPADANPTQ